MSLTQVALIDALTPEEELDLMALDEATHEAEICLLQAGDRILHDLGADEGGFCAGRVLRLEADGRLCIQLDGHAQQVCSEHGLWRVTSHTCACQVQLCWCTRDIPGRPAHGVGPEPIVHMWCTTC